MGCQILETTKKSGGESGRTRDARNGKRTFLVVYDATTPPATMAAVETATGVAQDGVTAITLPVIGADYPGDSSRKASAVNVKPTGDGLRFNVDVSYDTVTVEWAENPLSRKDDVSFEGSSETEAVFLTEETTPAPIVNSAGEPFDQLATRTTGVFTLTIEGNRASIAPATYAQYLRPNATNDASFTVRGITVGAGEAKMVGISVSSPQTENGVTYWRVKWQLALAPNWQLKGDDRGYNELASSVLVPITTGDPATEVKKPWPLDGSGAKKTNASDAPAVLDFPIYPARDFSTFGWTTTA